MVHFRGIFLAVLFAAPTRAALYSKSGPVQLLNSKSFDKEILQSDHAAIVEFFAPWCGHCKSLAPEYEKVAKNLKGLAKVAAVDCDDDKNKSICTSEGVQGFPTLKIYKPAGKRTARPTVEDYEGARTAKAIVEAVVERIPNHVTRLTSAQLNDWLAANNETVKVVLFSPKGTTSPLYRALAIQFLDRVSFTQIRDNEVDAAQLFGVEKFPTLILLPGGAAPGRVYGGGMKIDALTKFVGEFAPPKPKEGSRKKDEKVENGKEGDKEAPPKPPAEEPPKSQLIIPDLVDEGGLTEACFGRKSRMTCVIALADEPTSNPAPDPALAGLNVANERIAATTKNFRFFRVINSSDHGKALVKALGLGSEHPTVLTVNGARRWFRRFTGTPDAPSLLAWLDAIMLGDVKKERVPKDFLPHQVEEDEEVKPVVEVPPVEPEVPVKAPEAVDHEEL